MPLPKITTSEYELELPSNGKTVKYRPFLVREEKILILALESANQKEITNAVKQVIKECVLTKGIKIEQLPAFDIEYLFLNIRGKSVGESIDLLVTCGDDGETEVGVTVPIADIQVVKSEEHTKDVEIGDGWTVKMKYPSLSQFIETNFTESADTVEKSFQVIASCIDIVYNKDDMFAAADCTKKELKEWVESLTSQQFQKIEKFFETMPKLTHTLKVVNPKTRKENTVVLEGLTDFFA
jgi:hypothetical protein|tara:strand:- start:1193 stop:1909 length:717 start_codon:yes stop_codon:yes gene_type:complete